MNKKRLIEICAVVIGSIAFIGAQGSFAFWKQPRAPKHLKKA